MTQYVVVYLPDLSLTAEAVGPFRSRKRAEEVAAALDAADLDGNGPEGSASAPQIVPLLSLGYAIERLTSGGRP